MDEIEHEFDFRLPVEITEIFRVMEVKEETREIDGESRTGMIEQRVEYSANKDLSLSRRLGNL